MSVTRPKIKFALRHSSAHPPHEECEYEEGSAGEACRGCCGFSVCVLLPPCQRVGGSGVLHFVVVVYLKNLFHALRFIIRNLSLFFYFTVYNTESPAG